MAETTSAQLKRSCEERAQGAQAPDSLLVLAPSAFLLLQYLSAVKWYNKLCFYLSQLNTLDSWRYIQSVSGTLCSRTCLREYCVICSN